MLRNSLVQDLIRTLVGPAGGPREVLPAAQHPRDQYACGLLSPITPAPEEALDLVTPPNTVETEDGEEDEEDAALTSQVSIQARRVPTSFGVSFVLRHEGVPTVSLAVTFARYFRTDDGWERTPVGWLSGPVLLRPGLVLHPDPTTAVVVRLRTLKQDATLVSLYLLNSERYDQPGSPPVHTMMFQGELRICLEPGMSLADMRTYAIGPHDVEDQSLELLYRDRPVLARGHLCSPLWRDIDPALPWPDAEFIADPRFRQPDLRTTFIPLYNVVSPLVAWRSEYGAAPELAPAVLAEAWEPSRMRDALNPLCLAYQRWIEAQQREPVPDTLSHIAADHLKACDDVRVRLQKSIALLETNADVRLAFCFAQRAMALQWEWRGRQQMTWRSFQLAFMLLCLPGLADPAHPDRSICDLLWFPTGGGKTEAYLGVAAFTLALRRLQAPRDGQGHRLNTGVGVLSRYTLRLLTIQQYRRALRLIAACESLRLTPTGGRIGWRPAQCQKADDYLWGVTRFAAGLWVGGNVTPNRLEDTGFPDRVYGAFTLLSENHFGHGEPAQVMECPACGAVLSIPQPRSGRQERPVLEQGRNLRLHLVAFRDRSVVLPSANELSDTAFSVLGVTEQPLSNDRYAILTAHLQAREGGASAVEVDRWWKEVLSPKLGRFNGLACIRASRPGYFVRSYRNKAGKETRIQIEVVCPAPDCPLGQHPWREKGADGQWLQALPAFQAGQDTVGCRAPIGALTVDQQLYAHPPDLVVATVDKFARLAYEPSAASLFGNVDRYHNHLGYYRHGHPPGDVGVGQADPPNANLSVRVTPFPPPDLILQDELHLLDGPLGSMVGLFETVIDHLATSPAGPPKYIASTATVRQAEEQVGALFNRALQQFPPPGLLASDNFFSHTPPVDPLESQRPGRLYVGVCAPGRGALQTVLSLWSALLALTEDAVAKVSPTELDPFWTLVGYFNAIQELAEVNSLYRQEMPQRLPVNPQRDWPEAVELSSRMDPLQLPALLNRLESPWPAAERVALATSMFGTGVDVLRLGLMVVHGQPKTTSAYIQATGRVGRHSGALVVTFFSPGRPRDLAHYEFFAGYHSRLYQAVEPVSVAPFSPRARERALGPMAVALLRQGRDVSSPWLTEQRDKRESISGSGLMREMRQAPEVQALPALFESRAASQPPSRRPPVGRTAEEVERALDRWHQLAESHRDLLYCEYAIATPPSHAVLLGDAQHVHRGLETAWPNSPQSLRDVEATIGFKI